MPKKHDRASRRHHTRDGFCNPDAPAQPASPLEVARWLSGRVFSHKQNVPPHTVLPTDLSAPPPSIRITWIGHATTLIQVPGLTVLTDPHFGQRASPVPFAGPERLARLPLQIDDLPPVDLVVLSHDHYDHLHRPSIERLLAARHAPTFAAPLGCADRLRNWGVDSVLAFDWWEYDDMDIGSGLRLHALPALHFSGRSLTDRNSTLWASWMLEMDDGSVYFGGDTGYSDHFSTIADALGSPDIAILPIGAYKPRRIMKPVHVNPEEAMQAVIDLGRPDVVPIHWGTFDLASETVQAAAPEAIHWAERFGLTNQLRLLRPGESTTARP
ncbi:hypothetical protein CRI94_07350 [Longibacter salinarum]|uniref:Metallo-beta-lactamase domain-containing protein n=1 Tax=Longibacter salinarum TaxID=1850348 RepID=A0A2A8CZ63_9BACT|nr:MBL fold metallo-hydrolase [Longibacter salinarum]PEN13867.1 hypothetical protein CRI94_07350 [Longibacter salinarum]